MPWFDTNTSGALLAVLATGGAISAIAFGIGRSILLARITATEARRSQSEAAASTWRNKANTLERELDDAQANAQRELRSRADTIARLEDQLERAKRDAEFNDTTLKKRVAELEQAAREKDQTLAQQEREFRERVTRMTAEMKSVVAKLTHNAA